MAITPRVVDIYHGDLVGGSGPALAGFQQAAAAGVWGIIHKSSQGTRYKDTSYDARRPAALEAGLLWGAYHFNTGEDVETQVDWFIKSADPDEQTLMVLDFEDNPKSNMTVSQAIEFLHLLEEKIGRKGAIYSGNRLKEAIARLGPEDLAYVTSHRLWLCQYGPRALLPKGFSKYWLWQYTGDGIGSLPHYVPGSTVPGGKGIDLNVFNGTREELEASWA